MNRRTRHLTAVALCTCLFAAACGSDDTAAVDDETAAGDAWSVVFDSTTTFDAKAAHLEDADVLATTISAYAAAGDGMGGISLDPTAVVVDGDTATVTYDVLFGGTAAYEGQVGEIERVDDTWVVDREQFCSFMASARTPCD